jgi:hypothetical protein
MIFVVPPVAQVALTSSNWVSSASQRTGACRAGRKLWDTLTPKCPAVWNVDPHRKFEILFFLSLWIDIRMLESHLQSHLETHCARSRGGHKSAIRRIEYAYRLALNCTRCSRILFVTGAGAPLSPLKNNSMSMPPPPAYKEEEEAPPYRPPSNPHHDPQNASEIIIVAAGVPNNHQQHMDAIALQLVARRINLFRLILFVWTVIICGCVSHYTLLRVVDCSARQTPPSSMDPCRCLLLDALVFGGSVGV